MTLSYYLLCEALRQYYFVGSRALSFSRPLLSLSVEICLSVCEGVCVCVRNFEVKYLGNQRSYGISYYGEPIGKWSGASEW